MRLTKNGSINDIGSVLEELIVDFLLDRQKGNCDDCGQKLTQYQIHHKRYGLDINVYDLSLLCSECHGKYRKYKRATGLLRTI